MMYEKLTDRARKIFQVANQIAQEFNHEYIGTDHVMLSLIKERVGVASAVLYEMGLADAVETKLRACMVKGPEIVTMGQLPRVPRLTTAVEKALVWCKKLSHAYVGTEHLLLGLMDDPDNVVTNVIVACGSTPELVQKRCLEFLGHEKLPEDPPRKIGGPIPVTSIAPIILAAWDGNWVRVVNGKLEIRAELEKGD